MMHHTYRITVERNDFSVPLCSYIGKGSPLVGIRALGRTTYRIVLPLVILVCMNTQSLHFIETTCALWDYSEGLILSCDVCLCVCVCVFAGLLVYVAMMVGALVWGGLCDKMGRRKCLIYVLTIDLIFSFLSCFAQGYGFFLFFRFCSGFG